MHLNLVRTITDSYMTELINAYFYSFNNHEINHTKRTEELKANVGKKILGFARLSKISRYILYYMSSFIVSRIFFVKNQFYNRWICH